MAREPILIGLDESPIVIQAKGTDWAFNPDPPADFLITGLQIAIALEDGNLGELANLGSLLADQLTTATQRTKWNKAGFGVASVNAIAKAYIEAVTSLPTEPPSQSGKPRGGAGSK